MHSRGIFPAVLVTTGQALNTTYRYDPWGDSIGGTGSAYNPFQFTGVYRDSATSLYRMTQRYYQPAAGPFTQMDPLPESVMLPNRYEYAGCNPSNFVDPSGLYRCTAEYTIDTALNIAAFAVTFGGGLALTGGLALAGVAVGYVGIMYNYTKLASCFYD